MKKYLPALLLLASVFFGCKKSGNDKLNADLVGPWELESISGSIPVQTYPSGLGNLAVFTASEYKFYTNGALVSSGHYTIVRDTTVQRTVGLIIEPGRFTRRIVYDNKNDSAKEFIDITDGKLSFIAGFYPTDGGHSSVYKRLSASPF